MHNQKYFLLALCTLALIASVARADKLDPDGILRNDKGDIVYTTQYDAAGVDPTTHQKVKQDACEALGARMPTIRELAKESQSLGAKGILEVSQLNSDEVPAGYYKISAINPDNSEDNFYFSYEGYQAPQGDLGKKWNYFWSSSIKSGPYPYKAYGVDAYNGGMSASSRGSSLSGTAIRCVH